MRLLLNVPMAARRWAFAYVAALVWSFVAVGVPAHAEPGLQQIEVVAADGPHVFQVEMATTPSERERGLMFRRYMPKDRGMLFDFGTPEAAAMWMENTYISLDMLFIRADGVVARIETQAEPLSRRVIAAGEPVLGVLELNGGVCDSLGIKAGDKVVATMFKGK